jgi:hypothetical protein
MVESTTDTVTAGPTARELYVTLVAERDRDNYWRTTGSDTCPAHVVAIVFAATASGKTGAMYYPNDGHPVIEIYRLGWTAPAEYLATDVAQESDDPLRELVLLAHELGHHDLVTRGLGSGIFDEYQPVRTYEEEVGAWILARTILRARNFQDWAYFDEDERTRLHEYRVGLRIENPTAIEDRMRVPWWLANKVLQRTKAAARASRSLWPSPLNTDTLGRRVSRRRGSDT